MFLALDVASSELWDDGKYVFKKSGEPTRTPEQMVEMYADWVRQYPIISIEDGVAEGDWEGWQLLTRALGDRVQLVGDDVFVTNPEILRKGHRRGRRQRPARQAESDRHGVGNARRDSHRARGGLRDDHLAPLGRNRGQHHRRSRRRDVCRPDQDRSASRSDRIAKYNQLLRIEEELGSGRALRRSVRDQAGRIELTEDGSRDPFT